MTKAWAMRIALLVLVISSLPACVTWDKAKKGFFLSSYESVLNDYKHGRIMEARKMALRFDKSHPDYRKVRRLLKRRIEPARRRLLAHYTRKAEASESQGKWFRAKQFYEQAINFSPASRKLPAKAAKMGLKIRQQRLDTMIIQRRKEDAAMVAWLNAYETPKGLDPRDKPFLRKSEQSRRLIKDRAKFAYREARQYLRQGYPEVAYVEIESYLRLQPGSSKGKELRQKIRKALPRGLRIPAFSATRPGAGQPTKPIDVPKTVSAKDVRELLKKGEWLKARKYAQVYRREGGKGAESLLKEVEARIDKEAEAAFKAGRIAFRLEKLDLAVKHWTKAVRLRPNNPVYIENLRRAQQLMERLRILREEAGAEEKKPEDN